MGRLSAPAELAGPSSAAREHAGRTGRPTWTPQSLLSASGAEMDGLTDRSVGAGPAPAEPANRAGCRSAGARGLAGPNGTLTGSDHDGTWSGAARSFTTPLTNAPTVAARAPCVPGVGGHHFPRRRAPQEVARAAGRRRGDRGFGHRSGRRPDPQLG